jgi:hypothetical protein
MLAEKIDNSFSYLDEEIQNYFEKPIEQIQDECLKKSEYREKAA